MLNLAVNPVICFGQILLLAWLVISAEILLGWQEGEKDNDVRSRFTKAGCFCSYPDNTTVVNVHFDIIQTLFFAV